MLVAGTPVMLKVGFHDWYERVMKVHLNVPSLDGAEGVIEEGHEWEGELRYAVTLNNRVGGIAPVPSKFIEVIDNFSLTSSDEEKS